MNENQIQALGAAIGQAMALVPRPVDPNAAERELDIKRNAVRKNASTAPRYRQGENFNSFVITYESWRRASGIMETRQVAAVAPDPAQGIQGNNA